MHLCCAGFRSINQETFLHNKKTLEAYDAGLATGDVKELVLNYLSNSLGGYGFHGDSTAVSIART